MMAGRVTNRASHKPLRALPRSNCCGAQREANAANATELVRWLDATWQMIERTLVGWTVDDLAQTYPFTFQGKTYSVSRQWTIWHILAHDLHHSGEMAITLGMQAIAVP